MNELFRLSQQGFTLIELMIVVFLGVLLLTTGVPSFMSFIENNRVVAQTNNFVSALHVARSEAIKTGAQVTLCKSDSGTACASGGAGFERGWVVFVDDGATAFDIDGGERVLRVQAALPGNLALPGNGPVVDRIAYAGTGRIVGLGGTVNVCVDREKKRDIVLSGQGRVRTQTVSGACP